MIIYRRTRKKGSIFWKISVDLSKIDALSKLIMRQNYGNCYHYQY